MKLADIEAAFQRAILGESDEILASIVETPQLSRYDRFAVYNDAYRMRLAEFVGNDYPVLRNALGDDEFVRLAGAYIDATVSRHRNARWYGRNLPDFMAGSEAWRNKPLWIDLAFFERALADAFDAADATPLTIEALAAVAADDQPNMRFEFQPGLALLRLTHGTIAAYETAAAGDNEIVPATGDGEEAAMVWRDDEQDAVYRLVDDDEALALDAAKNGGSFSEICGLLAFGDADDTAATRAATFLAQWFGGGLVTRISC